MQRQSCKKSSSGLHEPPTESGPVWVALWCGRTREEMVVEMGQEGGLICADERTAKIFFSTN